MRLALVIVAVLAGCDRRPDPDPFYPAVPNPDPAREKDENDIRLIAFAHLLKDAAPGEVCFISFREAGIQGWTYPSDAFMSTLGYPKLTLRKVTEALHPKPGERDPDDPSRYRSIRDPKTGKKSYVYWVGLEWLGPDRVKASAGMTAGPLSGGGTYLIIVREKNGWVFKEEAGSWVH